jgi:cytochrome b
MRKVKVWDPFVRSFHWGLALLVLGAFLTSEGDALLPLHSRLGLAVLALLVARLAWGAVGPRHARFSTFVRGPGEVLAYARAMLRGRPPLHLSHNPLGGAMVVATVLLLLAILATGAIAHAGPEFHGPLTGIISRGDGEAVEEVHEALAVALLVMIAVHVAGVIASSLLERQNLVAGMITGWKRAPLDLPEKAPDRRRVLRLAGATALVLGVAAALGLALVLFLPRLAHAASPLRGELMRAHVASAGHDRDHDRDRGRDRHHDRSAARTPAPAYARACGACHVPYPPRFLPAASWRRILAGLDHHFGGQDVQLAPEERAAVERFVLEEAAPDREGPPPPLRITEQRWFRHEHDEVPEGTVARPSIGSMSSCAACHRGARSWDFDEDRVKIPAR